jgi:prepilin-type N-terminal cleavage/methylation domain-containing protein
MLDNKRIKKTYKKRSAFTLIEIAIVLIIIGLLVAGITGGASLIKAAQLRAVMAEARNYQITANAFLVKYDNLPGDHNVDIGTNSVAGDADGTIRSGSAGNLQEGLNSLAQLYDADMGGINLIPGPAVQSTLVIGANIVTSKNKTGGWIYANRADYKNVVLITGAADAAGSDEVANIFAAPSVTGDDATSIDKKMDDDDFVAGNVRANGLVEPSGDAGACTTGSALSASEGCFITFDL